MPRIQILNLPATPDEPAPFALVVDSLGPLTAEAGHLLSQRWDDAAKRVGGRGGIISTDPVEIVNPQPQVTLATRVGNEVGRKLADAVRTATERRRSLAAGGDVQPTVTVLVGEHGPERVIGEGGPE